MDLHLFTQFITAVFLGALIGAERERMQQKKHFEDFAGIRSFIFISLLGFLTGYIHVVWVPWFFLVSYTLLFLLITVTYLYNAFVKQHEGMTTELAAVLTFFVGFLCFANLLLATILGILITLLLTLKDFSHHLLAHLKNEEFYAAVKFAMIVFLVLPFLPDQAVDPWGLFNPYSLWLIVVMISGVSFLGYILTKVVGLERGSRYTAFFGGIVSSTAVNAAYSAESKLVKNNLSNIHSLISGVLLATGLSFSRILFAIYITNAAFFFHVWLPVTMIASTLILASFVTRWLFHREKHVLSKFQLESPFKLKTAIEFALVLAVILVVAEVGKYYFGDAGIYATALFSGMAKGDAIAVAVATLVLKGELSAVVATKALLLSISTSFIAKWAVAKIAGTKIYTRLFGVSLLIPFGVALTLFFMYG